MPHEYHSYEDAMAARELHEAKQNAEECKMLRAEVLALKQERDNAVFLLSHRDEVAEALLTSARESERRLRERVTAVARKYEFGYGVTPPMLALKLALTDDPPGQEGE